MNRPGSMVAVLNKVKALLGLLLLFAAGIWYWNLGRGKSATINWAETHQTIDGFGGSSADFLAGLTPAQADFFFTTDGIGLSILRTQIVPDEATCSVEFENKGCSNSNGQILNGELDTAKQAATRGAIVFGTPWSPPGAYKNNGTFKNGGSLLSSHYSDWASKMAAYVKMMSDNGVPIYAVSVQNEPDLTTHYGSCMYSAQQIHDFVPYLYSALGAVGAGSTKIMIAEQSSWKIDLTSTAMTDPKVAAQVGIIAAHGYTGKIQPFRTAQVRLWQTEDSSQSAIYDGSITDGLEWAQKIHRFLVDANVNAWLWWFLTDMPRQGDGTDNAALTDVNGNFPKRTFILGHWSKFVRPGWYRIGVSYSGPLSISAFKDPNDHSFAIVAVNPSNQSRPQTFSLNGFHVDSITPWITSASLSLSVQPSVPIKEGRFTFTLPASSVTTFSWQGARPN